ncbi:MAG: hypothetical protein M3Y48_23260 [Actinomycetota bacterium]|nr:hypothetical protein [Actinomycetota bacterium]
MPTERFRLAAAVYGIVIDGDDRILLMRRASSGYRGDQLSVPSGFLPSGGDDAPGTGDSHRHGVRSRRRLERSASTKRSR